ncbi:sterol desaturase family protein [Flavobacteriaceae bacterium]|jgi:beta-carotene 3-hydroxylase|uniref:sterol desaturase family protein n=1 Tax=Candidatus Arcticimaribacter forsetii TaxID=2820661 RepID=UPI002076DE71|nr:sterol desaturase family protein [Candidatus Arcticimaribacter forsetii]MCH1538851.1 sterol desaturase family protein [Flavobacteriaceae bacterium]MDB2329962.1 sterol desaturase family protein [Flavobacteriaceae bacterium]MDB2346009.1 sterol desaturase family protein [Flavobacteriaceae bacterium]MDB4609143.1 sterol desaturase family protein [Flavobacteriaceae bacterium]MDB4643184.1 sterol desaturase family protein [Flavobacteriaceae bacterium]
MTTLFWILIYLFTFIFMEFMAWFSHKYIMHGFLWSLHKDHHKKDHDSWFERNDLFFIFYAIVSMSLVILWGEYGFWAGLPMALGIFTYGLSYFIVHDIFIHQRFKIFKKTNSRYAKGLRRAHKMHHKSIHKEDGECFGMLWVPLKYFKQ